MLMLFYFVLLVSPWVTTSSLPDVYFLPGYGGNSLYATVHGEEYLPASCADAGIPLNRPIQVWYNSTLMDSYPSCLADLLSQTFDAERSPAFSFMPGVSVTTVDFGGIASIDQGNYPFFEHLKKWGYTIGVNAFGIPYDFRFSTVEAFTAIGFIDQFKKLVEENYEKSGGKTKGVILGHSNGGPTIYSLLLGLSKEWKEKYLSGIITLSGNMLGQLNCYGSYFYTTNSQYQRMETSWEASYCSAPWGDYEGYSELTDFIVTYSGTDQEKQYSPRLTDMQSLFQSVNRSDWATKLGYLYPSMNRSPAPEGVDVYCLYGSQLPTSYAFVFSESISDGYATQVKQMNGDDNQEITDNEFCKNWKNDLINAHGRQFESKEFPGVHHMEMVSDEKVMDEIWRILQTY
jgi:hypothetical protein